jgi:uncharacterized repeat protein (TIGR03803 family)
LAEEAVTVSYSQSQWNDSQETKLASELGRLVGRAAIVLALVVLFLACAACLAQVSGAQQAEAPASGSTVLYSFNPNGSSSDNPSAGNSDIFSANRGLDGAFPSGRLIRAAAGNLYGTTTFGGANNAGTVYKLDPAGKETVVYSFCPSWGCLGGKFPLGLTEDSSGNLYGATSQGGTYGAGTVFTIDATGRYTALYNFCSLTNCADGNGPTDLAWNAGKLYGVTALGGAYGAGVTFEMSIDGTSMDGQESAVTNCVSAASCKNANLEQRLARNDAQDSDGNIYRATTIGGAYGYGAVYRMTASGRAPVRDAPHSTTTTINSSLNPSAAGQQVTFTAVVTGGVWGPPLGGTVTFLNGSLTLGTVNLTSAVGGVAQLAISTLPLGTSSITASFGGWTTAEPSSSKALEQTVSATAEGANGWSKHMPYPTATTISSNLNPATEGEAVSFKAIVTSSYGVPAGTVMFYNGSTVIGSGSLSGGVFVIGITNLPVGTDSITASFIGSGWGNSSSGTLKETINASASAVGEAPPAKTRPPCTIISPGAAYPGTVVDITPNRDTFAAITEVTFNGTPATFKQASSTLVTATIPSNATSGNVYLYVAGGYWSSCESFTVE